MSHKELMNECEKYGCLVHITDKCKGECNAEKQEQEQASQ